MEVMHDFRKIPAVAATVVFAIALPALAFFPPEDSRNGVTARFVGFDETGGSSGFVPAKRAADESFEIRLDIANATDAPVSGGLAFWLNDDWDLALPGEVRAEARRSDEEHPEAQALPCAIPAHSTNSFFATAIPRPGRVLSALYPIHASFSLPGGEPLHPIAMFLATKNTKEHNDFVNSAPFAAKNAMLPLRLSLLPGSIFAQLPDSAPRPAAESSETGAFFDPGWQVADGDVRFGFYSQSPWRTGGGYIWRDIPVRLPAATQLTLCFSAALAAPIKDSEGRGDGADYKVFVVDETGLATEVHSSFVSSHAWRDSTADLSPWSGRAVTIRLWNGCGPANDPNYDRCLWGDVGVMARAEARLHDTEGAVAPDGRLSAKVAPNGRLSAEAAHAGRLSAGQSMPLSVRGETWTATFTPGPAGLLDGTLAFSDGERTLSFAGFTCAIDDILVGSGPLAARCTGWEAAEAASSDEEHPDAQALPCAILHRIDLRDGRTLTARATLFADGPALRIRWDMPGTVRTSRGSPRFTRLGIGPASLPAERAYLSFGNVLEKPRSFSLSAGNFRNLARHAGADYANGASLCQAVDVFPDRVVCRREANVFAVEACHDATFSFVPSARGAFAAARAFRDVAGYTRSPAWREAATRMCLDQWGGGYARTIAGLEKAAKYGVTNAVFVRHGWQRWGFDYRLPEIWPAGGAVDGFLDMAATAKRLGMLFVPHDNYIDHYPDAAGFSYDTIVFDADGTPHKAWLNRRKMAQSYRWAPTAFLPALRANAAALRDAFAPDGIFLDVFANLAPWDWFDRAGRFHPKTETAAAWGEAFDEYRRVLGGKGVAISETGHDALVGHLDAGQADHFTAAAWMSSKEYADSERVPWQDIVTHGSFVLYGGGLGWRYASNSHARGGDPAKGSGSDGYLCTTVVGGRTPMCDMEPFDPRAVTTWWLLGDVSRALALADFESFDFAGSIHRQHSVFSNGSQVWVNRPANLALPGEAQNGAPTGSAGILPAEIAKPPTGNTRSDAWLLPSGLFLPADGFYAETPGARAGIVELAGRRCAFAQSEGAIFVDGRPARNDGTGPADTQNAKALADFSAVLHPDAQALPCAIKTDGAFRLIRDGDNALLLTPIPGARPFRTEIDLSNNKSPAAGAQDSAASAAPLVTAVDPVEPSLDAGWPAWRQNGAVLSLSVDAKSFAYRIVVR